MGIEKRNHPRYEVPCSLAECALEYEYTEVKFIGLVCNCSLSGMCLQTSQPLTTGQRIKIKSKDPKLSETAIVRWFKNESVCAYRAGSEFA